MSGRFEDDDVEFPVVEERGKCMSCAREWEAADLGDSGRCPACGGVVAREIYAE